MSTQWKWVPVEPTKAMLAAAQQGDREYTLRNFGDIQTVPQGPEDHWAAMIAAAPADPTAQYTVEQATTCQNWKGMDGATAYLLIERHANGWSDVGRMMDAWLAANQATPSTAVEEAASPAAVTVRVKLDPSSGETISA